MPLICLLSEITEHALSLPESALNLIKGNRANRQYVNLDHHQTSALKDPELRYTYMANRNLISHKLLLLVLVPPYVKSQSLERF